MTGPPIELQDYGRRSHDQIINDLNQAWDRIRAKEREIAKLEGALEAMRGKFKRERLIRNIYGVLIVAALSSAALSLAKIFLGIPH